MQQERFSGGGGGSNQREADAEYAQRIAGDARFKADLDYADENAEMLARKRMKSETMKRQFAIQGAFFPFVALISTLFGCRPEQWLIHPVDETHRLRPYEEGARFVRHPFSPPLTSPSLTLTSLPPPRSCTLCHTDSGAPPLTPVVALGTRVYLALMETEELVPGHCRIVPVQHHLSCLEVEEEEGWEEIKVRLFLPFSFPSPFRWLRWREGVFLVGEREALIRLRRPERRTS